MCQQVNCRQCGKPTVSFRLKKKVLKKKYATYILHHFLYGWMYGEDMLTFGSLICIFSLFYVVVRLWITCLVSVNECEL